MRASATLRIIYSLIISATMLVLIAVICPVSAEPYRLGAQDRVRVGVLEWRAGEAEYLQWEPLNAEYTVNSAGAISLPLIGEVAAAGRTTEEVANAISDLLRKRTGLMTPPSTSIEIVSYRPVFIIGDIERPGGIEYQPSLTVLQAISLAGGIYRPSESGLIRLERDRISATGMYETARLNLRRMLVREARLEAELDGLVEAELPEELREDQDAADLLQQEQTIMDARRDALESQLMALADLKALYTRERSSLAAKLESQKKQIELAKRELEGVNSLVQQRLAVSSRETGLERVLAELEGKSLDFETAAVRAEQEVRRAERDSADLQKERRTTVAAELQETRSQIEQMRVQMRTAAALIEEASVTTPMLMLDQASPTAATPLYTIIRSTGDGATTRLRADEDTALKPGDVLRVDRSTLHQGQNASIDTVAR